VGRKATKILQHTEREDITTPMLALPDLQQPFEIEIDTSGYAMDVVLMQQRKPVCYHLETFYQVVVHYPTYNRSSTPWFRV